MAVCPYSSFESACRARAFPVLRKPGTERIVGRRGCLAVNLRLEISRPLARRRRLPESSYRQQRQARKSPLDGKQSDADISLPASS